MLHHSRHFIDVRKSSVILLHQRKMQVMIYMQIEVLKHE